MTKTQPKIPKWMKITAIVIFSIAILGQIILAITDAQWEKNHAEWEENHEQLLQSALETGDVSYCEKQKYKLGCVVMVGQKYNDITVCEQAYGAKSFTEVGCEAAVQGDQSYCEQHLNESELKYCKITYTNIMEKIS